MKVRKRVTVIANVICDEDYDTTELYLCQNLTISEHSDVPDVFVGKTQRCEIEDYVYQGWVTIGEVK